MAIDIELARMINDQEIFELYSAYIYLEIANYYAEQNLDGFANWYTVQTQEERDHALLFNTYLQNNGMHITLETVDKPGFSYTDFATPAATALNHERKVTARINDIYAKAFELHDFRTMQFLDWFVKEQGEEEKNAEDVVQKIELFGGDPKGLYMLDAELATRVYTAPSLVI